MRVCSLKEFEAKAKARQGRRVPFSARKQLRVVRYRTKTRWKRDWQLLQCAVLYRADLTLGRIGRPAERFMANGLLCACLRWIAHLRLTNRPAHRRKEQQNREHQRGAGPDGGEFSKPKIHKIRLRQPKRHVNEQRWTIAQNFQEIEMVGTAGVQPAT